MNLKNSTENEWSQTTEITDYMISFIWSVQEKKNKFIDTESNSVDAFSRSWMELQWPLTA